MRTPSLLATLVLTGCLGPWDPAWNVGTDTDTDTDDTDTTIIDTDDTETTDTDDTPMPTGSTAETGLDVVYVDASITASTTWTADTIWILAANTIVYVEAGTLTIEPGTTILGEQGSALIVTRDGDIDARGTADAPIVFTSAQPEGSRKPGDWGGVVLLGDAPLNKSAPRQIEGIEGDEPRAKYGGVDEFSDCGALDYVRIEYAGFEAFEGNELNGLTMGGCGRNTFIRHVQVHMGLDDGIELFGGTVDLKWIVLTGIGDDSLDWDEGWQGRVQFLVIHQYPVHPDPAVTKNGDEGFESDGNITDTDGDKILENIAPFSMPVVTNVTMLGSNDPASSQSAMHLKEGTGGDLHNMIVGYQTSRGLDIQDALTVDMAIAGDLDITHSLFFSIGATGNVYAASETSPDNDGDFNEGGWLQAPAKDNRFGDNSGIPAPAAPVNGKPPAWVSDPTVFWIPPAGSEAEGSAWTVPDEDFYDSVNYVGAVRPGATVPWWEGWVAFPYF